MTATQHTGDRTKGLALARQALYHLSQIPSPCSDLKTVRSLVEGRLQQTLRNAEQYSDAAGQDQLATAPSQLRNHEGEISRGLLCSVLLSTLHSGLGVLSTFSAYWWEDGG